jgi:hypothetical protein
MRQQQRAGRRQPCLPFVPRAARALLSCPAGDRCEQRSGKVPDSQTRAGRCPTPTASCHGRAPPPPASALAHTPPSSRSSSCPCARIRKSTAYCIPPRITRSALRESAYFLELAARSSATAPLPPLSRDGRAALRAGRAPRELCRRRVLHRPRRHRRGRVRDRVVRALRAGVPTPH